jgi:hypothetical protein
MNIIKSEYCCAQSHGDTCPTLVLNKDAPSPVHYLVYTLMNLTCSWMRLIGILYVYLRRWLSSFIKLAMLFYSIILEYA